MVQLRCPACGAEMSLGQAAQTADLQELDRVAAGFGADWPLIREYVDCFKGKRELKADKVLRLVREFQEMWLTGEFVSGGERYVVGRAEFKEALRATCNQVTPPLSNHNYLLRVLRGAAEKTAQRRERELRAREEGLRSTGRDACATEELPDDPAWRQEHLCLLKALRQAQNKGPEVKAQAEAALREHQAKSQAGAGTPRGGG